ncbi:hypothetical protein [Tropicimonas sp. IMCC34011]|uniref:hypothetical protein n=1 Tax=Tropicimonas sp. IMCC34011 TaxID=2248759 RepID=UPI001300B75D|nr:hypothetical protein [Tropicimonas sp. IMCC34011]
MIASYVAGWVFLALTVAAAVLCFKDGAVFLAVVNSVSALVLVGAQIWLPR